MKKSFLFLAVLLIFAQAQIGLAQSSGCISPNQGRVNVRSERSTEADVVAIFNDNQPFVNHQAGWYQLSAGGFVADWVVHEVPCNQSAPQTQPESRVNTSAGGCATTIGQVTVIHSGLNGNPGASVDSLSALYQWLRGVVRSVPNAQAYPVTLQYISTFDENKFVFPSIEGNIVGTEGSARYQSSTCTLNSYESGNGTVVIAGVSRNDLGHPEGVGFMAHEIAHSLGARHGFYAWDFVADRNVSLAKEQDAYYWGFLVTDAFYGCARFAPNVPDGGLSTARCGEVMSVLGL